VAQGDEGEDGEGHATILTQLELIDGDETVEDKA